MTNLAKLENRVQELQAVNRHLAEQITLLQTYAQHNREWIRDAIDAEINKEHRSGKDYQIHEHGLEPFRQLRAEIQATLPVPEEPAASQGDTDEEDTEDDPGEGT